MCCAISSKRMAVGWLEDVVLLERLVADKLRTEAETVAAENWKWIEG